MTITPHTRLLAIDPTRDGFAYVLLEDEILIDWGLVHAGKSVDASMQRLDELISRYTPDLLVMEHSSEFGRRRGRRAREFFVSVDLLGLSGEITVERVSQERVKQTFAGFKSKYEIALSLLDRYPELRPWRPRVRKAWMSEDERMNIFDALVLALTYRASSTDHYKPQSTYTHENENPENILGGAPAHPGIPGSCTSRATNREDPPAGQGTLGEGSPQTGR